MSTLHRASPTIDEGPAQSRRALSRCVPDPGAFAAVWGRSALLATAAELPRPFDDLLDLAAVDELLSRRGLRTPFLRLAKDGVVVPASAFTRSGGAGAAIGDQVDEAAVARLFADGTTIVLQALHRIWFPVIEFATDLRAELGHPIQVNAYVTPPSSRGFSAHYDIHDVFVLQLAGEKRWIVHEPVFESPLRTQPWTERRADLERTVAEQEPVLDVVLRPGDALYLPRGFIHAAEALGETCAHLTVGIHVITRHALVEALTALAVDDAELRRSLPLGLDLNDAASLADDVEATVDALGAHAQAVDANALADQLRRTLASASRPLPVSPLAQVAAARSVGPHTRVRLRDGLAARVKESTSHATLELARGTLRFETGVAPALRLLVDGGLHVVSSLPGADDATVDLVATLLLESVVVRADD